MVSKAQYEKIALSFAGVEKGASYGKPAFLVAKKFFTRLREEDRSVVLFVDSFDEREMLMEVEPAIFHVTSHYKDYPIVLARLDKIDAAALKGKLAQHWRRIAPKSLLKTAASPEPEKPKKKRKGTAPSPAPARKPKAGGRGPKKKR